MALTLAHKEYGAGPPVLILHGLFGSSGNWTAIARRLGERFRVFTLDLRNHGASPWDARMDYHAMADDVAQFIHGQGLEAASLIGHSLGGKVAMTMALTAPARVRRLVVVDIAPVPRPAAHAVEVHAMRALDLRGMGRRTAADAAMKPRIPDDAVRAFLLQNLVSGENGLRWRINLDAIADQMAAISAFPAAAGGKPYAGPTLVIRGALSGYVAERDLPAFARLFPAYRLVTIPGAGHWVHAERTEDFLAAVMPFLGER